MSVYITEGHSRSTFFDIDISPLAGCDWLLLELTDDQSQHRLQTDCQTD